MYTVFVAKSVSNGELKKLLSTNSFRKAARFAAKQKGYWIITQKGGSLISAVDYKQIGYSTPTWGLNLMARFLKEVRNRKVYYTP